MPPDPTQGAPGAQGDPAPIFSQEQQNAINSAVSGRLTRELAPLHATIAELNKKLAPPETKAADATETDPLKRVAMLEQKLAASEAREAARRREARESHAYSELKSKLAPVVRPEMLDLAAKDLFHFDKRVTAHEDGKVSFRHEDQAFGLDEGIAEWAKSKGAAVFLPPPKAGTRAPGPNPRAPVTEGGRPYDPLAKTLADLEAMRGR